ncbi:alpha-L-fucosidase [Coraliomargarita algicola]|uniref:alpha-L-fucosidase n=1 Tax=Coraliomargarita algicola TaxID=3092156 RepID=A0ABZ0RRL2_9BACT|nr:alpha-L-fucosidase [Coraliomargarita sp. J2-16]WPJ95584.1 alpha-L-fucosidase [Coraliomargarita sp. J2-16]
MTDTATREKSAASDVEAQHAINEITSFADEKASYQRTSHPDAQWFPEACLGMFIHWGISSVDGIGDLSWGCYHTVPGAQQKNTEVHGIYAAHAQRTPVKYWEQAEKFTCEDYDPEKWLSAARDAGVRYVVITTKHHDGFCLWPSEYGDFSPKNYLNGRDLLGEFVAAARKYDVKIGFYYSPPDWRFYQDYVNFGRDSKKPLDKNHEPYPGNKMPERSPELLEAYRTHVNGHVRELLTRYGQIDVLWFDGRLPDGSMTIEEIREIQPGILINPRGHGYGDFNTPECKFPERERVEGSWWEYCHVFSDGAWGYMEHETYKPIGWFLEEFTKARAWGGNWLPNVGPDAKGRLPDAFFKRMEQLKEWMSHSGESVIGTTPGNWPEDSNVPITHKGDKTYAHVGWLFDYPVEIKCLKEAPKSVQLLKTGEAIPYEYVDGVLSFHLHKNHRDLRTTVIVIE